MTKKTKPETKPQEKEQKTDEKEIRAVEKIIENKEITTEDTFGKLTRSQIDLIKRTIAKNASDDELKLFIQVCKGAQLNPFMRQVFLVPRWNNKEGREERTIQVSIDGLRAIAESGGQYAGNDDPVFDGEQEIALMDKRKISAPVKAIVTVYKIIAMTRCPFTATARWSEYYPGPKLGFQWHTRPYLMLGKCAEALALRKAFPKLLSGMYAQEELDQGLNEEQEERKQQQGLSRAKQMIENATIEELEEYKGKMEKSDKYTKEQKKEFSQAVDKKIKQLKNQKND